MFAFKTSIEKLCKFTFNLTNLDTIFIDSSLNVLFEYGHTQIPEILKPYFRKLDELLNLQDFNSDEDVFMHLTPYMTNFVSVKVCQNNKYLGSIIVGPYLTEEPNKLMIESIISENKLSISLKDAIEQYYLSLPLISTYKAKIIAESLSYNALNIEFMEMHNVSIRNIKHSFQTESPILRDFIKQNTEKSTDTIKKIYKNENDFLHAVEIGDIEKLEEIFQESSLINHDLQARVPNDPLRAGKNLAFVLNTLLRKAAEKGGLHPVDIHNMSGKYAVQIEQTTTIKQLSKLLNKMPLDYCKAVKKLSLRNYNYLTKKAIEYIRKNIDIELSLETISKAINVNPYVLSRQFKKETEYNITEYINIQRINEAVYIMENKDISITDIAYMVGFNDINYFSKVFKKFKKMTPSEYRKNLK
ncbi:helix-turn-helix domain-containing protein [Clostridium sp. SYSU_GA19001]|uniref:helix-turn-helix domain-containing protein n=1 Tax=Clostridium caldaquaticum TaxID=2940653 RepID=UPI0020770B29|nr:helix-turn-helix domain-containing protein [Clostridium caldaquaticum]MCM8711712.1 helix-turn-helix domain-containing protein [Clostridium caldaquaticum]